jgi:hypothetical protein
MKLIIKDIIICKKACIMEDDNLSTTTVGKSYQISHFQKDCLVIFDDSNKEHLFSINKKSKSYYEKWFCSPLRISRKEKLEKIKSL